MGSFLQGKEMAVAGRLATAAMAMSRGSIASSKACVSLSRGVDRGRAGVGDLLSSSGKSGSIRGTDIESDDGAFDGEGAA